MKTPASKFVPKTPRREKTTLSTNSNSSTDSKSKPEKHPVQVFCRLRPLIDDCDPSSVKLISPTTLCLSSPSDAKVLRKDVQYIFKHIFTSYASQKEVFDYVALPLLEDLLKGKNGLLFTYGVTGAGKTFTLTGDQSNPGIMPRCIDTLFNTIQNFQAPKFVIKSDRMNGFEVQSEGDALEDRLLEVKSSKASKVFTKKSSEKPYLNDGTKIINFNENSIYSVFVSYIEIYNNTVYDLLDSSAIGKHLQAKILREDAHKSMYVNGLIEVEVKSAEEAFELFQSGQKRKRMAHTVLNAESSRSHSIFSIRVVQLEQISYNTQGQRIIPDQNMLKVGQLNLVDLAGSERCNRTQNTGLRLREASSINNSLMNLRNCLEILRENQFSGHVKLVPYRDSRLTLLFKNYFEGHGRIKMIVCANPSIRDYEENLQVLKFAEMTQDVKVNKPECNYTPIRKPQKIGRGFATPASTRKEVKVGQTPLGSFGPKIPIISLSFENENDLGPVVSRLIKILKMRKQKALNFNSELTVKDRNFRKRLVDFNQQNIVNKSEIRSVNILLKKERQKSQNLETKITDLETVNDSLAGKNEELQDVIRSLQNRNNEKDLKLNQNLLEKQKNKQRLAWQTEKMNQELEEKLRRQREYIQAEINAKDSKIKKAREILDAVADIESFVPVSTETQTNLEPVSQVESRSATQRSTGTPSKRHRRSKSAGEVWLEHNVIKPVPLGTVLQPSMKRRKSVTKLSKAADVTNPKQNKYCLVSQEADTDGEMETKLYKGDIVPTCGGGAQVIFNDVERLRQESP